MAPRGTKSGTKGSKPAPVRDAKGGARTTSFGPKALGRSLAEASTPALRRFGFQDPRLILRWRTLVGPQLADVTLPIRLSRGPDGRLTLTIRVDGAAAVRLQHQAPQILSRINSAEGGPEIDRLAIVQGPVPRRHQPQPEPDRPLTHDEETWLQEGAARVEDATLRARLVALGARILLRKG